jgi:arylformamidase
MKIYDISVTVPIAPVFPGDPITILSRVANIKDGSHCNLTKVSMCLHAGTHADAPLHFVDDTASIEKLSPALFVGETRIVTVYKKEGDIEAADLKPFDVKGGERILIKTRNSIDGHISGTEFYSDFCALAPSAAQYLVECGITLVGIDYASIGHGDSSAQTHRILLAAGIAVLEWLDLSSVKDGDYFLSAAPVKIAGAEGSPTRALLLDFEDNKN